MVFIYCIYDSRIFHKYNMKIKKFSEFITEGMWGSALKRSNTAKERKDDEANRIQEFINKQREPESIYITDGNVINSKSNITILDTDLINGKLPFKFGRVDGYFDCDGCFSLTSLEGAPQEVGGDFYCSNCTSLTSLEGSPQEVGIDFSCYGCTSLTSLKGVPQKVGGDFCCSECSSLTTLEGAPQKVGRDFICSYCPSLTSLEGAPQEVGRNFYCSKCPTLTSHEGAPKKLGGKIIN